MNSQKLLGPTVFCTGLILPVVTWIGGYIFNAVVEMFGHPRESYLVAPLFFVLSILIGVPMAVAGFVMMVGKRSDQVRHRDA